MRHCEFWANRTAGPSYVWNNDQHEQHGLTRALARQIQLHSRASHTANFSRSRNGGACAFVNALSRLVHDGMKNTPESEIVEIAWSFFYCRF